VYADHQRKYRKITAARPRHTFGGNQALSLRRSQLTDNTRHGLPGSPEEVKPLLKLFAFMQAHAAAAAELRKREEGQTMAEYGVVLAVITVVVIAAIGLLSTRVGNAITGVADILPGN
jgi:Flp pilus assembly pilin Flp